MNFGRFCVFYSILFFTVLTINSSVAQTLEPTADLTFEELVWIKKHPVLKASNELEWAPLDFYQDGKAQGLSVDYLNLVASKVGIKIDYVTGIPWNEQLGMLKNKEIDISHSILKTPEREEFLNFTRPYLDIPMVYFGRKGSERITSFEDLIGKRIGVVAGTVPAEIYKKNYPELTLVEYGKTPNALRALSTGAVDILADNLPIASYIINKNLIPNLEVVGDTFYPSAENTNLVRLAARKDLPILLAILQKGMSAVTEEEFRAISQKWQSNTTGFGDLGLTQEEMEWLSENNIIRVALDPNSAPVEFIDEKGKISGISGSYLEEIGKLLNVKFVWAENKNWGEAISFIKQGKADMLAAVTATEERKGYMDFVDPYMTAASVIFTLEGGAVFGNLDALNGHKISQVKSFAINEYISKNYPDIEIVTTNTVAEAVKLVAIGEVDAYVGNIPATAQAIADQSLTQIIVAGETDYKGDYTMGVRKDYALFTSALSKALKAIPKEKKAEISRNWLALKIENRPNYDLVWKIIVVSLIVVAAILYWNRRLHNEVESRKKAEMDLLYSEFKAKMAQEKAELAQAEAENANAAKSRFLANMSHEIRTPLNAIIGFSEVMISGIYGEIKEPRYKEYLKDIKDSGEHLATVINDILDLSKIEAGKWVLDEKDFVLYQCISEAIQMLMPHANQKNIMLTYEGDASLNDMVVCGDVHAFKRAIINLISNAVKYSNEGGVVKCDIKVDDGLYINISDNGIGIPENRIEQVLRPFEQIADTHVLNEEGTGLGLPIVTKLVELHGGKFSLESRVNEGTRATITMPPTRIISNHLQSKQKNIS